MKSFALPVASCIAVLLLSAMSSCNIGTHDCDEYRVTQIFPKYGPYIEDTVALEPEETYEYDTMNAYYVADQGAQGRASCPAVNKRPMNFDSLVIEAPSVVEAKIVEESKLQITAQEPGTTDVKLYMSATTTRIAVRKRHEQLSTTAVVQ